MRGFVDSEPDSTPIKLYHFYFRKFDQADQRFDKLITRDAKSSAPSILVTKSEILDKRKRALLGGLATVLQTTWFIVQYLERWGSHQPRTQLEGMTLAHIVINIVIYFLWWDKPFDIQMPIDIRAPRIKMDPEGDDGNPADSSSRSGDPGVRNSQIIQIPQVAFQTAPMTRTEVAIQVTRTFSQSFSRASPGRGNGAKLRIMISVAL